MKTVPKDLAQRLLAGDRRAVARMISLVEEKNEAALPVLDELWKGTTPKVTVGITGAPGSGKSTLTDALIGHLRTLEQTVGVIAVDPTSPFSGGALLGDRVRMQDRALDPGVYIRSMASRGHLGGLSVACPEAARVLEAAGFDAVFIETVGVGQSEVEVASRTDTTVVVLAPGMGDGVQAVKAGILEVADVFCVNKADREGARETVRDLKAMLDLGHSMRDPNWFPPIVQTTATVGEGVPELWDAINSHREHLGPDGLMARRRQNIRGEIQLMVAEAILGRATAGSALENVTDAVASRKLTHHEAVTQLLDAAN